VAGDISRREKVKEKRPSPSFLRLFILFLKVIVFFLTTSLV
jgi:hypothetical protein